MGGPGHACRGRGPRLGLAAGSGRAGDGLRSHAGRVPSADGPPAVTPGASARKRHQTLPVRWPSADGPGRASWVAWVTH